MADIRINQLPAGSGPVATDFVPLDNGSTRKATVQAIVEIGRPAASQAEAEAGTNPTKVMTPLTTKQAVTSYGLLKENNLNDVSDVTAARTNLGLGDSATRNVGTTAGTVAAGDDSRIAGAVQTTRAVNTGTGLTGGGNLSSDLTLSLGAGSIASLALADSALQPTSGISKLASFAALDGGASTAALLADQQREWMFLPGDFTADLAKQGYENFYIPPTSDPTGASGVYALIGAAPTGSWNVNDSTPARIHRVNDRVFGGLAAAQAYGSSEEFGPAFKRLHTWLGGWTDEDLVDHSGPGFYLENSAQWLTVSSVGGIGLTGASRASDKYRAFGYSVWEASETVSVGAKRGYQNRLYTATVGGTTSTTPPSHTSGTATDGTVTWQFDRRSPGTPIGVAAIGISDIEDGDGRWASYTEGQREPGAATIYGRELAMKNMGDDVHNNPYNRFPGGATIGDWFAGGGDASVGAPANPSTAAILIGKNAASWNKGIVFTEDALTLVGSLGRIAVAMPEDVRIAWFTSESASSDEGVLGAFIDSDVDETAKQTGMTFSNDTVKLSARGGILATFENGAAAGTPNHFRFISKPSGDAPVIFVDGTDANINLIAQPKGSGLFGVSYASFAATTPANFVAERILAISAGGSTFFIAGRTAGAW